MLAASAALAGPLDPPPGPIAPTAKPLAEVEPRIAINATNTPGDADSLFRITQPGSYYLTGNIIGVASKHGIEIGSGSVVLDLNGFAVISSGTGLDGVTTDGLPQVSVTVRNGVVSAWGNGGIDLEGTGHIIEDIHARVNAHEGIVVGVNSLVANCQASGNQNTGIVTGSGGTLSGCAGTQNIGSGIETGPGCTLVACSAALNTEAGINTGSGCSISDCTAYDNSSHGFQTSTSNTVSHCAANSNGSSGIFVGQSSNVLGCTSNGNTTFGIQLSIGGMVVDCYTAFNVVDGILCSNLCTIRGNSCSTNGSGGDGAGIHVTGGDNHVEGNTCKGADRGIDVDGAGNIIIRNTCSSNTINWTIAANNVVGPILDRTAPASAAISGSSAPDSTGSTHPNANFSY
jgi:parallel beta-helix repeat protein